MPNREIPVVLKFLLDKNAIEAIKKGTLSIEDAMGSVNQNLLRSKSALIDISEGMKKWETQSKRMLVSSAALTTGIFLYSQRYIKNLEKTNSLSREWEKSEKSIEKSNERIGKVVTSAVLPAYEKGARVLEKVAKFAEQNPQIVKTAFNLSLLAVGFSAMGVLASKGIKLAADASYVATTATQLLASKNMQAAANKQLAASAAYGVKGGQIGPAALKGAGALAGTGVAATVATTLAVIASGAIIGTVVYDILAKKFGLTRVNQFATVGANSVGKGIESVATKLGMDPAEAERKTLVFTALIAKLTGAIDENSPLWIKAANSIKQASEIVEGATLAGSKYEKEIVDSYTNMLKEEAAATDEYEKDRLKIVGEYNKDRERLEEDHLKTVLDINRRYQKQIQNLANDYLKDSSRAEQDYRDNRADIIRDSGEEINRIEQDSQERLQKLRRDFEDESYDAASRRDALALIKAARDYERAKQDETKETNKEISRRNRDTAIRLQDLAQNFNKERERKLEDYKQSLEEAKAQRAEQLKIEAEKHAEELKQLRDSKNERLKLLRDIFIEETNRRREAFIQQVRDLDAALLGEKNRKQAYYNLMLADAERFLQAYRQSLPSGGSGGLGSGSVGSSIGPNMDTGGYASQGQTYKMAVNGVPEYVMDGQTTRIAEKAIGGRLTQDRLTELLMNKSNQSGDSFSFQNRFDTKLSNEDKRAIEEMFVSAIEEARRYKK